MGLPCNDHFSCSLFHLEWNLKSLSYPIWPWMVYSSPYLAFLSKILWAPTARVFYEFFEQGILFPVPLNVFSSLVMLRVPLFALAEIPTSWRIYSWSSHSKYIPLRCPLFYLFFSPTFIRFSFCLLLNVRK